MTKTILIFSLLLNTLVGLTASGHPGSGIVVDKFGQIYFSDTGKGVWKIDTHGEIYVLEWHDVTPENHEVRSAWLPRFRKIGLDGRVTTLATVSRN